MQILLIMLIVVLLAFSVLLLALAKQSPREKQTEDKEQGRIHQGLCRNSKTDRRKYEEVRTLESNCDISDHL
ncbi:MAG: hypothetical protein ACLURP_13950 [Ruminococcus sp.]